MSRYSQGYTFAVYVYESRFFATILLPAKTFYPHHISIDNNFSAHPLSLFVKFLYAKGCRRNCNTLSQIRCFDLGLNLCGR